MHVLSLTEIPWVSLEAAQVWRLLLWAAELSLLTTLFPFVPRLWRSRKDGSYPEKEWTAWIMLALTIVVVRWIVVQAERWEGPVYYEDLPVTTVVVLILLRARRLRLGRWI